MLPQSKQSFAGYAIRQGLAIAMEHNFMMSAAGRENFKNQLTQLVGSIQLTNDLDVHVALLSAPLQPLSPLSPLAPLLSPLPNRLFPSHSRALRDVAARLKSDGHRVTAGRQIGHRTRRSPPT